jgi:hypothetical protein
MIYQFVFLTLNVIGILFLVTTLCAELIDND